ncbi:MAG TPA: hypothetical protein PKE31_19055 [Pseudomonadota bacterium]|jgi:hypothetical protein|nr:hypothetical protein [Pseudomonadota bacterium]
MAKAAPSQPKTPMEMVEALNIRMAASARSYKMATVRYLLRPPLSLRAKYAAFLLDFAQTSDLIQEVLGRASERATDQAVGDLLRKHQREEKNRMQLVLSDLRRLGFSDDLPDRPVTTGDIALRAYCANVSGDKPHAMLGVVLALFGVASEVTSSVIRLLSVGSVPREAMRWLLVHQAEDAQELKNLVEKTVELIRNPTEQAHVLEAVEVAGELLALGAAARPAA